MNVDLSRKEFWAWVGRTPGKKWNMHVASLRNEVEVLVTSTKGISEAQ